jgi:hypothetical protein
MSWLINASQSDQSPGRVFLLSFVLVVVVVGIEKWRELFMLYIGSLIKLLCDLIWLES